MAMVARPASKADLSQLSITQLKGVGDQFAQKLYKLGIVTIQDLLFHLPLRYIDRTRITPISAIIPNTPVVIEGEIRTNQVMHGKRYSLLCRIQDASGAIAIRFFHFSNAQKQALAPGTRIRCFGEARRGSSGLELYHPEYRRIDPQQPMPLEATLTPIYPTSEGLTQHRWRSLMAQAIKFLKRGALQELLPNDILRDLNQVTLETALDYLHHPPPAAKLDVLKDGNHPFQQRLAFEELLAHQLSLLKLRHQIQQKNGARLNYIPELENLFLGNLQFSLTAAQQRVYAEIKDDLSQAFPMLRLVQGDVGSGKTVVAALTALQAVANKKQAAIMAPTEILSEQHYLNFSAWCEPLGISVGWLTSKVKGKKRNTVLSEIENGSTQIVIGTHSLLQNDVNFCDLALVIIDEQHRFGVHQRLALRTKGKQGDSYPHQLIMTATPIPRTLAMSAYADLDCSIIDELPPGRKPVATIAVGNEKRPQIIERVKHACTAGKQAYWVCTLIEESEALQCQAAEATAEELKVALPTVNIGLIHGRMKAKEKTAVMECFKAAKLDLLVATTVIEVGVDVPNASLMIIENPERLGLAQLHQLRGRVGRGAIESFCALLYNPPLSQQSRERLNVMRETNDGFIIAEKDLELRGPGEVLGTRQTGEMVFRIANLQRNATLLPQTKKAAQILLKHYPQLVDPIITRWLSHNAQYAHV